MAKRPVAKKAKATDVESHWSTLIEGLQYSSQEFYQRVEQALEKREVPDLQMKRVDWEEGGVLSARREYLRLERRRLVFDVCGAPFGTGFFVSEWIGKRPLRLGFVFAVVFFAIIGLWAMVWSNIEGNADWFTYRFGGPNHAQDRVVLFILFAGVLSAVVGLGSNIEEILTKTPVLRFIYNQFFQYITFYRIDLVCMYCAAVHAAVLEVIDEITKAKGIAPLSEFERRPIHAGFIGRR